MARPSPGYADAAKAARALESLGKPRLHHLGSRSAHWAPFRNWMTPGDGSTTMFWPSIDFSAEGWVISTACHGGCGQCRASVP